MRSHFSRSILLTSMYLAMQPVQADVIDWNCNVGKVNNPDCWDPQKLPTFTDNIFFRNSGTATLLTDVLLNSQNMFMGYNSSNIFEHDGGDNAVKNNLNVGYYMNNDSIAYESIYRLNQGQLYVGSDTIIGHLVPHYSGDSASTAGFEQTGGSHDVQGNLVLSKITNNDGSSSDRTINAYYTLSDGQLTVENDVYLGQQAGTYKAQHGEATFNQTGGTHQINGDLVFADGSRLDARYNLNDGELIVKGDITSGDAVISSTSELYLGGGDLTLSDTGKINLFRGNTNKLIINADYDQFREDIRGITKFSLDHDQSITVDDLIVGQNDAQATFTQKGNSQVDTGYLRVGYVDMPTSNLTSGRYTLDGDAQLNTYFSTIGQHSFQLPLNGGGQSIQAQFIQNGGEHNVVIDLQIANQNLDSDLEANYTLNDGNLTVERNSIVGLQAGERPTRASFVQNGGTHHFGGELNIGSAHLEEPVEGVHSEYVLNAGRLAGNQGIVMETNGQMTVNGGSVGTLYTDLHSNAMLKLNDGIYNSDYMVLKDQSRLVVENQAQLSVEQLTVKDGSNFYSDNANLGIETLTQQGGIIDGIIQNNGHFDYQSGTFGGRLINNGTVSYEGFLYLNHGLENNTQFNVTEDSHLRLGGFLDNNGMMNIEGILTARNINNYGRMFFGDNSEFRAYGAGLYKQNLTNYGSFIIKDNSYLDQRDWDIVNAGNFDLNGSVLAGDGILKNNTGGMIYGQGTINSNFTNSGGNVVVNQGSLRITNDFVNEGTIQMNHLAARLSGGDINNGGTIEGLGNVNNSIANSGTIEAIGGTLTLSGQLENNGLMTAGQGSKLLVSQGLEVNDGVINLNGGTFDNNQRAMLNTNQLSGHGVFRTGGLNNVGTMTFTGGPTTINGNVNNSEDGLITASNDTLLFTHDVDNQGQITAQNSQITFAAGYSGVGVITGNGSSVFRGELTPGNSPGTLNISGDAILEETSITTFEIGGLFQGLEADNGYDWINVEGTATLLGSMEVVWWDDFSASEGDSFEILTAETISGEFDILNLAELDSDLEWNFNYYYDDFGQDSLTLSVSSVSAVPEPSTYALMLSGLGLIGFMARRRKQQQ